MHYFSWPHSWSCQCLNMADVLMNFHLLCCHILLRICSLNIVICTLEKNWVLRRDLHEMMLIWHTKENAVPGIRATCKVWIWDWKEIKDLVQHLLHQLEPLHFPNGCWILPKGSRLGWSIVSKRDGLGKNEHGISTVPWLANEKLPRK